MGIGVSCLAGAIPMWLTLTRNSWRPWAWGRQDALVPIYCGELYHPALPNSTLRVIDRRGHCPH